MKVMVFAAGQGSRMQPLTNTTPKVLIPVAGKPLISYLLTHLAHEGFEDIIINIAHFPEQFYSVLGDGAKFGVNITYSVEKEALETGGAIIKVLPLLDNEPFLAVSGDIWTHYPFASLVKKPVEMAHLILVHNPAVKATGDFGLRQDRVIREPKEYIFASMGVYHPALFEAYPLEKFSITKPLNAAIDRGDVTGEFYQGDWLNVGTPELLGQLEKMLL